MKHQGIHFSEKQLIMAVIDDHDLDHILAKHLSECPICMSEKKRLEQELKKLGDMAKALAPDPKKKPLLLPQERINIRPFRPVLALGVALILLLMILVFPKPDNTFDDKIMADILLEMEKDQQFFSEVNALEQSAFQGIFPENDDESYGNFDDEFLEFLLPMEVERFKGSEVQRFRGSEVNAEPRTQNPEPGAQNVEPRAQNDER